MSYHLLHILRQAPEHGSLRLYNQDLAGFFTSIDQQRFLGAWSMLLDLLRPHMNVSETEVFSVYPGRFNNPGDIIKGRTFRRLNVTRKVLIKDIPSLLTTALNMQTFCLGQRCLSQLRGSPMGSPLSPALCLMVVSISEQIWATSFKVRPHQSPPLCSPHSLCRQTSLVLGDPQIQSLPPYEVLLDDGFYGKPIVLETEPDQEFLGFMLETNPLELIYFGPTNVSQVLSPFSASPPKVLLSGFRSRCHIVVNGAFPAPRVQQIAQLVDLYSMAGFDGDDLTCISSKILTTHMRENIVAAPLSPVNSHHTHLLFCDFSFSVSFLPQPIVSNFASLSCLAAPASYGSFPASVPLSPRSCLDASPPAGSIFAFL